MEIQNEINSIKNAFFDDIKIFERSGDFDALYLKYFSKSRGEVTNLVRKLPKLSENERKTFGPVINEIIESFKTQIDDLRLNYLNKLQNDPFIDLTLPVGPKKTGFLHPATQVIREINDFFRYYGYSVCDGPEIENADFNFRRLNLPDNHPATDLQDTLFISQPDILLRTHTSSVESRILTQYGPPIRAVIPGKCYRNETANKSNNSYFYQYQGVVVDEGITVQNLKETITLMLRFLFGDGTEIRCRYKYYPEVSPGLGFDIKCTFCNGGGCEVCKGRGWLEIGGSGMIHYNTLKMCGIDPEIYTGFAFGMGLDRMVMSKFNISDIRKLYSGRVVYV